MRTILILVGLLMINPIMAKVYKSVDDKGNVSYSDRPTSKQDEQIELKEPMSMPAYEYSAPMKEVKIQEQAHSNNVETNYTSLAIVSPADGEGVRANDGVVNISASIEPALQANHNVQFLLDGKKQGSPSKSTSITLNDLERGSHSISFQIVADNGNVIKTSPSITFHVLKTNATVAHAVIFNNIVKAPKPYKELTDVQKSQFVNKKDYEDKVKTIVKRDQSYERTRTFDELKEKDRQHLRAKFNIDNEQEYNNVAQNYAKFNLNHHNFTAIDPARFSPPPATKIKPKDLKIDNLPVPINHMPSLPVKK